MYDVFLSYKHTDGTGNVTEDTAIAAHLFQCLTERGYRVFFSQRSLEDMGSAAFKQEIDNALDSVRLLIVVLTKAEYASSKWVQYEWDSFFSDYLSGVRNSADILTFCKGVSVKELPRTLRGQQSFDAEGGLSSLLKYVGNILPREAEGPYRVKKNTEVVFEDLVDAVRLDHQVYPGMEHVSPEECWKWFCLNPDVYVFIQDTATKHIVAYTNTSPVTEECYERIRSGEFLTTNITTDMVLNFEMPYPYSLYFFSIVIHPEHQNTALFFMLLKELVNRFIRMSERGVYIKRMIADAVTPNGERFCKLFGMSRVTASSHDSTLYEVRMIPPKFKVISKSIKELHDCYQAAYDDAPYLFDEE